MSKLIWIRNHRVNRTNPWLALTKDVIKIGSLVMDIFYAFRVLFFYKKYFWIPTLAYSLLCYLPNSKQFTTFLRCWMNETLYTNVLVAPVCISMLLNLLFLFNIVRVLLLKLQAPLGQQGAGGPSRNIIQAFRYVTH